MAVSISGGSRVAIGGQYGSADVDASGCSLRPLPPTCEPAVAAAPLPRRLLELAERCFKKLFGGLALAIRDVRWQTAHSQSRSGARMSCRSETLVSSL